MDYGFTRKDRNEDIRKNKWIALVEAKPQEYQFRWFGCVQVRPKTAYVKCYERLQTCNSKELGEGCACKKLD